MIDQKELLRKMIAGALPKRDLAVKHDELTRAIVAQIEKWKAIKPQIKPHADKVNRLTAIADKLNAAVKTADAALLKLGVHEEMETVLAKGAAMGIPPDQVPLGGHTASVDLYLVPRRASAELQKKLNRIHRPPKQRPKEFGPQLTAELHRLCCQIAGCSAKEFEGFLQELNDNDTRNKAGLPQLRSATLKKRAERSKTKAKDKVASKRR